MIVIEHRRSTVREGVYMLLQFAATLIGFIAFYALFGKAMQPGPVVLGLFIALIAIVGALFAGFATWNIVIRKEFICRITDQMIECASPPQAGETFRIPIADIAKVERQRRGKNDYKWYLWDTSGRRYWLTANYGNPVREFVRTIKEVNPSVVEFRT